jgi:hypothetical protein
MDRAVLDAYGWADVDLDHEFRGEGKEARYTLSEGGKEELLRRLLELNFEIAAKEQSQRDASRSAVSDQPKGKKGKESSASKGRMKKSGGEEGTQQLGLL